MISKKVADQSHFGSNIQSLFYGAHIYVGAIQSLEKWKPFFFKGFGTGMKLLSICPNFAWNLVHKYCMNCLSKERKDTYCHILSQKDQKLERKFTFHIPKFMFPNRLKQKTGLCEPNPQQNAQVFLQILNPAKILAPELVGDQC